MYIPQITLVKFDPKNAWKESLTAIKTYRHKNKYMPVAQSLKKMKIVSPRGTVTKTREILRVAYDFWCDQKFNNPKQKTIKQRLYRYKINKILAEIKNRQLTTPTGHDKNHDQYEIRHKSGGHILIAGSWVYEYTSTERYTISACYIYGVDEGQTWACRVPSTIKNVDEALTYITPRQCRNPRPNQKLIRQGDIFALATPAKNPKPPIWADVADAKSSHGIKPHKSNGWILTHKEHKNRHLSKKYQWRIYQGKQLHTTAD